MALVRLTFTRAASVVETGYVVVEVDDPLNMNKILGKAERKQFKKFLVMERDYDSEDEDWEFELIEDEEPDNDDISYGDDHIND